MMPSMEIVRSAAPDSIEDWYRRHATDLIRLGALACGDVALAEDAVQEVFATLYRKPPVLRDPDRPLPYLRTAVLNRCRSGVRRRLSGDRAVLRLVGQAPAAGPDVEGSAVSSTAHRQILTAVRAPPRRQRDVVLLRHWLQLSEAEIAETLGIAPGTVKSAASRARLTLAPILEALR